MRWRDPLRRLVEELAEENLQLKDPGSAMLLRAGQPVLFELDGDGAVRVQGDMRRDVAGDPGAVGALGVEAEGGCRVKLFWLLTFAPAQNVDLRV